jgi:hypothetical protein
MALEFPVGSSFNAPPPQEWASRLFSAMFWGQGHDGLLLAHSILEIFDAGGGGDPVPQSCRKIVLSALSESAQISADFLQERTPASGAVNQQCDPSPKPASFSTAWREAIGKWFKTNLKSAAHVSGLNSWLITQER